MGYLFSVKATVNISLLTIIIPNALKIWLRRNPGSDVEANFFGAALSLLLSCFGVLCVAIAPKVWILIVGRDEIS